MPFCHRKAKEEGREIEVRFFNALRVFHLKHYFHCHIFHLLRSQYRFSLLFVICFIKFFALEKVLNQTISLGEYFS